MLEKLSHYMVGILYQRSNIRPCFTTGKPLNDIVTGDVLARYTSFCTKLGESRLDIGMVD
jgi:hypothetical protein